VFLICTGVFTCTAWRLRAPSRRHWLAYTIYPPYQYHAGESARVTPSLALHRGFLATAIIELASWVHTSRQGEGWQSEGGVNERFARNGISPETAPGSTCGWNGYFWFFTFATCWLRGLRKFVPVGDVSLCERVSFAALLSWASRLALFAYYAGDETVAAFPSAVTFYTCILLSSCHVAICKTICSKMTTGTAHTRGKCNSHA
jgi:hypothetical protein